MEKQFVTYEIAVALKKLGFDEPCLGYFNIEYNSFNGEHKGKLILGQKPEYLTCQKKMHYIFGQQICLAPLWQQVKEWFREKHNTHIEISFIEDEDDYDVKQNLWYFIINDMINFDIEEDYTYYHSYEEAREAAIWKAIELIKET